MSGFKKVPSPPSRHRRQGGTPVPAGAWTTGGSYRGALRPARGRLRPLGVDFFEPIASGLLDRVPPPRPANVGSTSAAAGAVLLPARPAVGPDGPSVGIDAAPSMVERAATPQRLCTWTTSRSRWPTRRSRPVRRNDVVVSKLVLFFLSDPAQALRSWRGAAIRWTARHLDVRRMGPAPGLRARRAGARAVHPSRDARPAHDGRRHRRSPPTPASGPESVGQRVRRRALRDPPAAGALRRRQQWFAFSWSTGQRGMWLAVPGTVATTCAPKTFRRFDERADADGSATFTIDIRYAGRRALTRPAGPTLLTAAILAPMRGRDRRRRRRAGSGARRTHPRLQRGGDRDPTAGCSARVLDDGGLLGAAVGRTFGGCGYVDVLWVRADGRGPGHRYGPDGRGRGGRGRAAPPQVALQHAHLPGAGGSTPRAGYVEVPVVRRTTRAGTTRCTAQTVQLEPNGS